MQKRLLICAITFLLIQQASAQAPVGPAAPPEAIQDPSTQQPATASQPIDKPSAKPPLKDKAERKAMREDRKALRQKLKDIRIERQKVLVDFKATRVKLKAARVAVQDKQTEIKTAREADDKQRLKSLVDELEPLREASSGHLSTLKALRVKVVTLRSDAKAASKALIAQKG